MKHFSDFDNFLSDLLKKDFLFAAYSLPNEHLIHVIIQNEAEIKETKGFPVDTKEGFFLNPFDIEKKGVWIQKNLYFLSQNANFPELERIDYSKKFESPNFHEVSKQEYLEISKKYLESFKSTDLNKAVLSRVKKHAFERSSLSRVFLELNKLYPDSFVFMVNLPGQITWIGASPEALIEEREQKCSTMALAATKPRDDKTPWSPKEIEEQEIVSRYIREKLDSIDLTYNESELFDKKLKSGIKHLCKTFDFEIKDMESFSKLVNTLHPTPAVAGKPLQDALELIQKNEGYDRTFYTGYLGPVNLNNSIQQFVNLRSAVHTNSELNLFIGGGLTQDSVGEKEWEETEIKSKTILKAMEVVIN